MGDFVQNKIINLAAGNFGALRVLTEVASYPESCDIVFHRLSEKNIMGSKIWILYKYICKNAIVDFMTAVEDGSALDKIEAYERRFK